MPETPKLIYWDSNVFLSYVNELSDRMPVLDVLFETSSRVAGSVKIHTSTLTQVEVAFAASEQVQQVLDPQIEGRLNALWADPEAIVSVEYHAAIGQVARSLIRSAITEGWSLKPLDAVHWRRRNGFQILDWRWRNSIPMTKDLRSSSPFLISLSANLALNSQG